MCSYVPPAHTNQLSIEAVYLYKRLELVHHSVHTSYTLGMCYAVTKHSGTHCGVSSSVMRFLSWHSSGIHPHPSHELPLTTGTPESILFLWLMNKLTMKYFNKYMQTMYTNTCIYRLIPAYTCIHKYVQV